MNLLFDQGTPAPLGRHLPAHSMATLADRVGSKKGNGELLDLAERNGYAILVTINQSLSHQQNLGRRRVRIVVLLSTDWSRVRLCAEQVGRAIGAVRPSQAVKGLIWRPE